MTRNDISNEAYRQAKENSFETLPFLASIFECGANWARQKTLDEACEFLLEFGYLEKEWVDKFRNWMEGKI